MNIGVIVANTGSPEAPEADAVEHYLRQFLMDPRIRQLPKPLWKYLVYKHILPKRKHTSAEHYQLIWTDEGSPLLVNQQKLIDKVQALYDASPQADASVALRMGMSYGQPSIISALQSLRSWGADKIVLLPLYPQSAFSPTQAVVDSFKAALQETGWDVPTVIIDNYHDNPLYIDAIARQFLDAGFDASSNDRILCSFHSIPNKDQDAGDTYCQQIEHGRRLVAQKLGVPYERITIGYQSVFGHRPDKWQGPLSRLLLRDWRKTGQERVFVACPGFAVDCLETLYDVPFELCPALEGPGIALAEAKRFVWVGSLGCTDEHAAIIKNVIDKALGERVL